MAGFTLLKKNKWRARSANQQKKAYTGTFASHQGRNSQTVHFFNQCGKDQCVFEFVD
jgi:hypothetical protein